MSEPAGVILLGVMLIAAWFANVPFFAGYLVNREIAKELGTRAAAGRS